MGHVQELKWLAFSLYPLSFFLYSPFNKDISLFFSSSDRVLREDDFFAVIGWYFASGSYALLRDVYILKKGGGWCRKSGVGMRGILNWTSNCKFFHHTWYIQNENQSFHIKLNFFISVNKPLKCMHRFVKLMFSIRRERGGGLLKENII